MSQQHVVSPLSPLSFLPSLICVCVWEGARARFTCICRFSLPPFSKHGPNLLARHVYRSVNDGADFSVPFLDAIFASIASEPLRLADQTSSGVTPSGWLAAARAAATPRGALARLAPQVGLFIAHCALRFCASSACNCDLLLVLHCVAAGEHLTCCCEPATNISNNNYKTRGCH